MITSSDNNEVKICFLRMMLVGHLLDYVLDHIFRSYDPRSCEQGVTIAFFFGVSLNK